MDHYLVRATIIPVIISYIVTKCKMTEMEALESFYTSITGGDLANDGTGLYGESPLYLFGLYLEEKDMLRVL